MQRKTSIIILTYNNLEYTKECLASIRKYTTKEDYEIIIVDNASSDKTKQYLREQRDIKVVFNETNKGFPKGCNQGIAMANPNNDILLLNNDTIVTKNWLNNLKICLESDEKIGAVGPVCNQTENRQGVKFDYKDIKQMHHLASKNNISNATKWEEKIFLIGYCLLIKREVINKLRGLDEKYTPGYIEDNDLCLRIINLGYRLMLCHDCFIHHYLGTSFRKDLNKFYPILYRNRDYFYRKWHFNTIAFDETKTTSFPLLDKPKRILELDCGIGTTILAIKYLYKDVLIEGIEQNKYKRLIANRFTKVYSSFQELENNKYDCILLGDILERVKNINGLLQKLKRYLTNQGVIIGMINNIGNVKKIIKFFKGFCYDDLTSQNNFFGIEDIKKILDINGYKDYNFFLWYEPLTNEEEAIFQNLGKQYPLIRYSYYTFKAIKK